MGSIKIIQNTDKDYSSLQQEALGQTLCYFKHSGPIQFQYFSSYSLKFLHAGSIYYKQKRKKTNLAKGDILILPGKQETQAYIGGQGAEGLAIFFKEDRINNLIYNELIPKKLILESHYKFSGNRILQQEIINLCQDLFLSLNDINSAYSDIATIYERLEKDFVQSLIALHYMNLQKKISLKPTLLETVRRLAMAVDYIHSNFHQKIKLEDIAGAACISKYCFLRHFKEFYLMTPNEYLINYRIDKATQLIKLKKISLGTIAMDCGFGSPQYFNYTFRKKLGYPPSRLCA